MAYLHPLVKECIQYERAFCTARCPFGLDVRDFVMKITQGRFNAAYKTYQYSVGFPGIVSRLCDEPCRLVCPMHEHGGAIAMQRLEQAVMQHARSQMPDQYNMPPKEGRIAVVGGGISGLACALRLATRKYQVTVYERSDRVGGHLHQLMPSGLLMADIEMQFAHENYELLADNNITDLQSLNHDALYVATGKGGDRFGLEKSDEGPFATNRKGVFMGGSLTGAGTMKAIADGLAVAGVIEAYLKTGSMTHEAGPGEETKLRREVIRVVAADEVWPGDNGIYTREEARAEAGRCLRCSCDACVHYSPLLAYYSKFPRRLTEEVEVTITPSSLDGEATLVTRLISSCNHCGLCREVCPVDIDTGAFLLESHYTMREKGKMPWAFHHFYLRDMAFANSEAAVAKMPAGSSSARYMFFPGCQLGASDPELVRQSYNMLLVHYPETALLAHCCGAPADWAGEREIHQQTITSVRNEWVRMGKPEVLLACPMCRQMFQRHLPEIPARFIYTLPGVKGAVPALVNNVAASVFDPCAARDEPQLQERVREIAREAGFDLRPLPMEGKMAECCSYGGQVAVANPGYAGQSVKKRIEQNDLPYITYCSNCRDIFARAGKRTWHILELILGTETQRQPTQSDRRRNRLRLKESMTEDNRTEEERTMKKEEEKEKGELIISDQLREKLDRELILEQDVIEVIRACEESGNKLYDPANDSFTGHQMVGEMTCWVVYRDRDDGRRELVNSYCHRMKIEE